MKTRILQFLLTLLSLNVYSQFDDDDTAIIETLTLPDRYSKIYYADSLPKLINEIPYSGIDTCSFVEMGEKLFVQEIYINGFKVELKTFYDNGNQCCYYQYKNGKRDGINRKCYKSGKIMFDYVSKEGKPIGTTFLYYENGNPEYVKDYDTGISIGFYEDGKCSSMVRRITDISKCPEGKGYIETTWYEDGQLKEKGIMNCGKQIYRIFANDSTMINESTIIGMPLFRIGKYSEFYNDGKPKLEGYFKEGNSANESNIKTGIWKYWNRKGELVKEEFYENNMQLKKVKEKKPSIKK